jgi:hypothetical protein
MQSDSRRDASAHPRGLRAATLPTFRFWPQRARFGAFQVGFVVCGLLAMATFFALSWRFSDDVFALPQWFFSAYIRLRPGIGLVSSALIIFVGPQLAFALLGGAVSRFVATRLGANQPLIPSERHVAASR